MSINNHFIKLVNDKHLIYNLIYSLKLVELKHLKVYIKNNLANKFIRLFKLLTSILISFIRKKQNFHIYTNC